MNAYLRGFGAPSLKLRVLRKNTSAKKKTSKIVFMIDFLYKNIYINRE